MAETETIKPALTPEQWEECLDIQRRSGVRFAEDVEELFENIPHAAAALALYGAPYGFTREDVENLDALIAGNDIFLSDENNGLSRWGECLRSIRDRIASLLPPEGV